MPGLSTHRLPHRPHVTSVVLIREALNPRTSFWGAVDPSCDRRWLAGRSRLSCAEFGGILVRLVGCVVVVGTVRWRNMTSIIDSGRWRAQHDLERR